MWLGVGFLILAVGCPYLPPIDGPPVQTNFRPDIEIVEPIQQSGVIYNAAEDQIVEFRVNVEDPDTPDSELEYAWFVDRGTSDEQERARGIGITFYPLVLSSVTTGPHTVTIRVKDGLGEDANEVFESWEFEVQ